eukprot:maker-scaffold340_size202118-snap-gene-0.24 protein:Tk00672 transcript:maker-scaffold340_size202118-snap-gene-0.24-mRNA-1 annotation:"PREDICTED: uncharacterized protein LOC102462580 isoform X1"
MAPSLSVYVHTFSETQTPKLKATQRILRGRMVINQAMTITVDQSSHKEVAKRFIEYEQGTVPIILSVPHGGTLSHPDIPDRTSSAGIAFSQIHCTSPGSEHHVHNPPLENKRAKVVNVTDMRTIEIARIVANTIEETIGKRPYLVISHLRRSKLDINREVGAATHNHPEALTYYQEYHALLQKAKSAIGQGVVFDLHGQAHMQNSTEIGYLLSKTALNEQDLSLTHSSIRSLAQRSELSDSELISGLDSLGAFLECEGYRAVPSPRQPCPGTDKYYRGGYITRAHGSLMEGQIDAIQLETPREVRQDGGPQGMTRFAQSLGRAIARFYLRHYQNPSSHEKPLISD